VILESLDVDVAELERRTGWALKPQGACKAELCVPMPPHEGGTIGANIVSERLGMALVEDAAHGLWVLGPDTVAGRALASAEAPDLELPDWHGEAFRLSSLRGLKVLLLAWASW
jgi:hypothetical protein